MTNFSLLKLSSSSDSVVAAYETLRAHVLAGSKLTSQTELLVLLRQGITAWMVHRSASVSSMQAAPAATHTGVSHAAAAFLVRDEMSAAIVRVVANMALGGQHTIEMCI